MSKWPLGGQNFNECIFILRVSLLPVTEGGHCYLMKVYFHRGYATDLCMIRAII